MKGKNSKVHKRPIDPERVRRIPAEGFSWIDRRFVREGFIERLSPEAILLYLFLVAVSDARGLSFYAEPTILRILKLNLQELTQARSRLVNAKLILYTYPIYQVLPLPPQQRGPSAFSATPRGGDPMSLGDILKLAMAKAGSPEGSTQEEDGAGQS